MTMTLQLPFFLDTSFAEHRSCLLRKNLEWEPNKKPPNPMMERLRRKTKRPVRTSKPYKEADEFQTNYFASEKPPNQVMEDWRGKPDKEINQWKTSRTQSGNMGRKLKDHRYHQWKNLPSLIKERDERIESGGERRDLVGIKYYSVFSGVELPSILTACKLLHALPGRQISGYLPGSGSKKPNWLRYFLCCLT